MTVESGALVERDTVMAQSRLTGPKTSVLAAKKVEDTGAGPCQRQRCLGATRGVTTTSGT